MTPPQKERIIDQAMHMFVSQGIKSVRMDDIAQQLGVSKRTLYEIVRRQGRAALPGDGALFRNVTASGGPNSRADARNVLEAMFMVLGGVMDNAEVIAAA